MRIDAVIFNPIGILVDEHGEPFEDAAPALAALASLGVKVIEVETLSEAELARAVKEASLSADGAICLTDNEHGIRAAKAAGVRPVLMMNDPDDAMRLTALDPFGGVVSLHELPDFIRFVHRQSPESR